ncbi:MAG TPA: ISNCY family transposase [Bacteroidales bacterium]|nr:MAG: hypothetical protein A2X01_12300 [Bacteroidetes bacterium GWF2_35_48]OFZ00074.1 MAG: hypothetical protein A2491_15700 [Bacteroidetes bacterium RIFOXYC12_FULL_35_7]HBX51117.1 ISNCY family transposase [Bacteroidales bacterium]
MKIFNDLVLKFEKPDWSANPEFGLIDTILETHPEIIELVSTDLTGLVKSSHYGRKDTPTVEQILRAAIFKEMKNLDYRELEFAQLDSRICATFIKLDLREPFCFQLWQKYISQIKEDTLKQILYTVNKIAIEEGFEDIKQVRQDTTVVESNIQHPTNNFLTWSCIKESHRLLEHLKEEVSTLSYINYKTGAKKTYFKINVTKQADKKAVLFNKQLITFTKCINQVSNIVKKNFMSIGAEAWRMALEKLLPLMHQVYNISYRKEILGEVVPNDEKIFSIYELHTDIIVKGQRDVLFGHKINIAGGRSNLILDCDILRGNPSDTSLYQPMMDRIIEIYNVIPRDSVTDGGFASKENIDYSVRTGIVNTVFNKIKGSMQNVFSSKNMATRLKKWRSGIEAVISNVKRGFDLHVCNWKGWEHFNSKILWSVLAYNFRVFTQLVLQRI